jgi:hypothetical protein
MNHAVDPEPPWAGRRSWAGPAPQKTGFALGSALPALVGRPAFLTFSRAHHRRPPWWISPRLFRSSAEPARKVTHPL